jgi:hypothetical protein
MEQTNIVKEIASMKHDNKTKETKIKTKRVKQRERERERERERGREGERERGREKIQRENGEHHQSGFSSRGPCDIFLTRSRVGLGSIPLYVADSKLGRARTWRGRLSSWVRML